MFGQHNDESQQQDAPAATPQGDATLPNGSDQTWQHPGSPLGDDTTHNDSAQADTPDEPATSTPTLPASHEDVIAPTHASDDDLVSIKQQALTQLSPLVGHLDQTPEEKFRTTMMMIQASDDQALVKTAYEAAQKIEDEKTRAQALLDIVNEINYFTQHSQN
ncbi:MAG TPA: hypothetical protein VF401_01365 [Candidatus Saccharimonadales bacterium]